MKISIRTTWCVLAILFTSIIAFAQDAPPPPGMTKEQTKQWKKEQKQREKEQKEKAKQDAKLEKERAEAEARERANRVQIRNEYDKFADAGRFYFLNGLVDASEYNYRFEMSFGAGYSYRGAQPALGGNSFLAFKYTIINSYSDLSDHNLVFIIDGEREVIGQFQVASKGIVSRSLSVTLTKLVPNETLIKLANARTVEGRLGNIVFTLKDRHIAGIKEIVNQIPKE